jgi:hypothetical protein
MKDHAVIRVIRENDTFSSSTVEYIDMVHHQAGIDDMIGAEEIDYFEAINADMDALGHTSLTSFVSLIYMPPTPPQRPRQPLAGDSIINLKAIGQVGSGQVAQRNMCN